MSAIRTVAVCGAGGTMGAGIAIMAARAGFPTICHDVHGDALARARKQTDAFFAQSVERGKMSAAEKDAAMGQITHTTSLDDLSAADLVIEAVFEELTVKRQLFGNFNKIAPSRLVELVCQPATRPEAIAAAKAVFEAAGLVVVVCADHAGRIIDRLVRPKYNAALRFLDEGLGTAKDMDMTCRLGLGYPDGPIERVERGGLTHHYDVTHGLFETHGTPGYAPARRAVVAKQQEGR